ncbi:MAG: FecR domain-containing protein [Odoribacteraceae bacterium]|nr:FecR domain-containing protein [Odoribacteraceae bacterium]
MNEHDKHARIIHLLVSQWQGSLTDGEREEIEAWKRSNRRNRALHDRITSREFLEEKLEQESRVDHVAGWLAIDARHAARRRARIIGRTSAAVVVALAVVAGITRVTVTGGDDAPVVAIIAPGEMKAELTLPGGSVIQLDRETSVTGLLASEPRVEESAGNYHVLSTPRGGEYTMTLPDGTTVFLNSESRLGFPGRFGGGERRVSFTGEAYFEVARDASSPFRVEVNGALVEVLGTSFNVRAYADEQEMQTTLVKGSVMLSVPGASERLVAGEQGTIDREGRLGKREVDVELYTGWKEGYFAFDRDRLEKVMHDLARWYKIEVVFEEPELKEISFTGIVRRYGDFNTVVRMLEMTGDTRFVIDRHVIRIRK